MKQQIQDLLGGRPYILKARTLITGLTSTTKTAFKEESIAALSSDFIVYAVYSTTRWFNGTPATNTAVLDQSDVPEQKSDYQGAGGGGIFPSDPNLVAVEQGLAFQSISRLTADIESYTQQRTAPAIDAAYGRVNFPAESTWVFLPAGLVIPGNVPLKSWLSVDFTPFSIAAGDEIKVVGEIELYGLLEGEA